MNFVLRRMAAGDEAAFGAVATTAAHCPTTTSPLFRWAGQP